MSMPGMTVNTSSKVSHPRMDSMPGMDMGSVPTQNVPDGLALGTQSTQMDAFAHLAEAQTFTFNSLSTQHDSPQNMSGCTQERCAQSSLAIPAHSSVPHPHFVHLVTAEILATMNLGIGIHRVKPIVLPPEGLSVEDLRTSLRI